MIQTITHTRTGAHVDHSEHEETFKQRFFVCLVTKAKEEGGLLIIGASRDRRLRQWVFGSTPDTVIERAKLDDVPVLIYASSPSIPERIEDYLFSVYRYLNTPQG